MLNIQATTYNDISDESMLQWMDEMEHHEDDLTFEEQDEYDRDNGLGLYARPLVGGPAEDYSCYYAPYDEDDESELLDNSDSSVLEDELRRQVQQSDIM